MDKIKEKIYGRIKLTSDSGKSVWVRPKYPKALIDIYAKVTKKKIPLNKIINTVADPEIPTELLANEMRKRAKSKMV